MNKSVFRAYDIRGIYPDELNERDAFIIGKAIYKYLGGVEKAGISRDARLMAPAIQNSLMAGLASMGAEVEDLGMISSDTRSFATGKLGYDLSISVTASHNPKEWIGMKIAKAGGVEIGGSGEIVEIGEIAMGLDDEGFDQEYEFEKRDILPEWLEHVLSFVEVDKIKPLKVVVDAGNGVAGPIVMGLAEKLPITVVPMFFEPDGSFPNHLPSPIEPENIADLQKRVVEENADLGMAFDGDADRVFLVDEKGGVVTGSEMTAMIIDSVLSQNPTATVLYNAVCGWNVRDVLVKYPNAKSYRTKVGHGYIKKDIKEYDAEFAGEHSGHYFFKNNQGADSGLIAAVIVLQLLSSTESSVSEFLEKYRGYVQIPETNFRVADAKQVMEGLAEKYSDAKQDHLDGLTLYWDDAWASIRASSNEPLLRLNVEANTTERLDQLAAELANTIQQLGQASSEPVEG